MTETVYLLAPQGSSGSAIAALNLFEVCNRIAGRLNQGGKPLFNIQLVLTGNALAAASNSRVLLQADCALEDIPRADAVIFIAAPLLATSVEVSEFITAQTELISWLSSNGSAQDKIASHCAGSYLLAEAGLLETGATTTAWYLAADFQRRYPHIDLQESSLLCEQGNIICGGATSAGNDVVLQLIQEIAGRHYARLLAKYMLLDNQRQKQAPYVLYSDIEIDDPTVANAKRWIQKHLAEDFCVNDIAEHVKLSTRTLIRRFRNSIDESPQSLTQKLRVEKSKVLLETTALSLNDIIVRVGYSDESAFRRIFTRLVQLSPVDYRRRFNSAYSEREFQAGKSADRVNASH